MALAASVANVQKASPVTPPIGDRMGNRKVAAAITTTAAATVARIKRVTLVFTGDVKRVGGRSLPRPPYQPRTPAPPASASEIRLNKVDISAPTRINCARMLILLELGLPALREFSHQKVPSSEQSIDNRHTPVTERSVALLAPRQSKCPRSTDGSTLPRLEAVPKYYYGEYFTPRGTSGSSTKVMAPCASQSTVDYPVQAMTPRAESLGRGPLRGQWRAFAGSR